MQCAIKKTAYHSWCAGELPKGCKECVEGKKLVLFITGFCAQRCWYCPVSEEKFGKDVVFANEWQIKNPENPTELFEEARLTDATGAGITGGDPLVMIDRCAKYIRLLKTRYGKKFHIHLYTPLRLVTEERLKKLSDAGLDEIRFHPRLDDKTYWPKLKLAKAYNWKIGVEIPAIPGLEQETKTLIDYIKDKVSFLNLNELERSDTSTEHYELDKKGYKQRSKLSYAIKGSRELSLKLAEYARKKKLDVHVCTAKLKDAVQVQQRLKLRAKNVKLPFDECTEDGLLIRGCLYAKGLEPGLHYKKRRMLANEQQAIKTLKTTLSELRAQKIPCEIDTTRFRLIVPLTVVYAKYRSLKKKDLIPAIVEEFPTSDSMLVNVDIL